MEKTCSAVSLCVTGKLIIQRNLTGNAFRGGYVMVPKVMVKKGIKASRPKKGRKDNRRPPAATRPLQAASTFAGTPQMPAATAVPTLIKSASPPNLVTVHEPGGKVRTLKKWCFERTPAYVSPNESRHSAYLEKGAVVELTGQKQSTFSATNTISWTQVVYKTYDSRAGKQWMTAWVNDAFLDDYNESFPDSGVLIRSATDDPHDAQQYMVLDGKTRYNMCGPLCVAFLVEDEMDVVLEKWKTNSPVSYQSMLAGGKDSGTTESDLKKILGAVLGAYGYGADDDQVVRFRERLTFPVNPTSMTQALQSMLATHALVVLVTINKFGQPIANTETPQIQHWVIIDKITRNGNRLETYNPFPNKREEWSFNEFYRSCRVSWSGLWVKRKPQAQRSSVSMEILPRFEVTIENRNPAYTAAQYLDIDGKKKTNLCGPFCASFLVKDSIEHVLKRWKEVQPTLYAASVGANEGTSTFDLSTILKIYGYNNEGDILSFGKGLTDPYLKKYLHSPGRMTKMLEKYFLIAGVNIDGTTGKLRPGNKVRHWVVVDKISPEGKNGGWVQLYNPFQNCWEEYTYREFEASVGAQWAGLWVKRTIVPKFEQQTVANPIEDAGQIHSQSPNRRIRPGQWTETQVLLAYRQQSQKGIPINKIASKLEEKSGWKKRELLDFFKRSSQGAAAGKWSDVRLRAEIEKKRAEKKPPHRIASELTEISGRKRQEILTMIRQAERAGGGERWTEEQLLTAIEERFKTTKSPHKVAASLVEESGWKNWEISKLLKAMKGSEKTDEGRPPIWVKDEPQTIVQASKPWAEFQKWQDELLAQPGTRLRRVRRWGDPVMVKYGFDVNQSTPSNFQAVGLYNDGNQEFGAVQNFIRISHADMMRLRAMQIEDEYKAKQDDWRKQKMNWLCKFIGTIYFFDEEEDQWPTAPQIRWGTLALGGNLVQVEGSDPLVVRTKLRDPEIVEVEMVRLRGFRASDWGRPLDELLAQGLVHRCFCAYSQNDFGESPKGIVYSPFFSPLDWDFSGPTKPTALYIPVEWLEPKA